MALAGSRDKARSWPGLAAGAIAIACNLWVLGLDFATDDFLLLRRVSERFVLEPWITDDACSGATLWFQEMVVPVPPPYMFRPAAWTLWWTLARVGGAPLSPVLFHGALLALHGLTVFVLFKLLRRATSSWPAALAAVAFGLAPGSIQAVSWVSATGDTLLTLFLILSAMAIRRSSMRGSLASDACAGLCFALAVASKESAAYFAPAVGLAALLVPRGERPSPLWRVAAAFAVPFAVLVLARRAYIGTLGPPWSMLAVPWHGWREIRFLGQALAPWDASGQKPAVIGLLEAYVPWDARTTARVVGAGFAFLPALAGLIARPRRVGPRLAALVAIAAIGIIPISRYLLKDFEDLDTNGASRAAYPLSALIAAAIAFGIHAIATVPRWLRAALVVPLLAWQAHFLVHVARVEQAAAEGVRVRRASLAAIAAKSPPDTWFVAVEKSTLDISPGVPNNYWIEDAFQRPFVEKPVFVTWAPRSSSDLPRCVWRHRGAVQMVFADEQAGAYDAEATHPPWPPLPAVVPPLERVVEDDGTVSFRFKTPVPGRAIGGIRWRVRFDGKRVRWGQEVVEPPLAFAEDARVIGSEDAPPPAEGEIGTIFTELGTRPPSRWTIRGIELLSGGTVDRVPEIVAEIPTLTLTEPSAWSVFDRKMPAIAWNPVPNARHHLVEINVRIRGIPKVSRAEVRTSASRLSFDPDLRIRYEGADVPWREAQKALDAIPQGAEHMIQVEFRVIASDQYGCLAGISDWRSIYLEPEVR